MSAMRLRRAWQGARAASEAIGESADAGDADVALDAERSLVAALQESDTAVETMQDTSADGRREVPGRAWTIGAAGLILAGLGLLVARRRR